MPDNIQPQEFVRLKELAGPTGLLRMSKSTIYSRIAAGQLPAPLKSGRVSLWRRADIIAAVEALQR